MGGKGSLTGSRGRQFAPWPTFGGFWPMCANTLATLSLQSAHAHFREHRVIPLQYPTAQRTRNFLSCPTATASTKAPPSNGATPSPTVRAFHHVPQRPGLRVGFDTWTLFYISSPLCPMRCTIQMGWYAIKNQESTCFSWMDLDSDAKRDPSPIQK